MRLDTHVPRDASWRSREALPQLQQPLGLLLPKALPPDLPGVPVELVKGLETSFEVQHLGVREVSPQEYKTAKEW